MNNKQNKEILYKFYEKHGRIFKLYKVAKIKSRNKFHQYFKGDKLYVSNLGRCKINDNIVEPYVRKDEYCLFGGKSLHRIVYELFIGKIPEEFEIDHIDTNPRNNSLDNLRVCTKKENQNNPLSKKNHSDAQKRYKHSEETKRKLSDIKPKKAVVQYTKQGVFVKEYGGIMQAERETKINHGTIIKCCKGKLSSAGGFIWRYKT